MYNLDMLYDVQSNPRRDKRKKDYYNQSVGFNYLASRLRWYEQIRRNLIELLVGRFVWEGLPDNMPMGYLERGLIENGRMLIFENQDGVFVGKGAAEGYNHYEQPTAFTITSPTITDKIRYELGEDRCVLVNNNVGGISDIESIDIFARLLAEIKVTQGVNLNTLKTPFLLKGNDEIKNSLMLQLQQVTEGNTYVMIDDLLAGSDNENFDVLDVQAPFYLDKLQEYYEVEKNSFLEELGVYNDPNPFKKERKVVSEIEANKEETIVNRELRLDVRKQAAEEASKVFGKEITVSLREGFNDDIINSVDSTGHSDGGNESMGSEGHFE